jgi:multisubunit Na+/H+ antiporter MnhB subunit
MYWNLSSDQARGFFGAVMLAIGIVLIIVGVQNLNKKNKTPNETNASIGMTAGGAILLLVPIWSIYKSVRKATRAPNNTVIRNNPIY